MLRCLPFILLALFANTAVPVQAQTPDRDWKTLCKSDTCTLSRKLQNEERKSVVTTFFVVVERGKNTIRAGSLIPLGVAVQPGIRFVASSQVFEVPVDVCYPDGCRAQREFTESQMTQMTSSPDLQVQFFPYGLDAPVFVRMPTEGLAAAIQNAQESFN
jgi:invasion protein IalB